MRSERCAHDISINVCGDPKCRTVHFALYDEHGEAFAQACLRVEHIPGIINELQNAAYEVAATKEEPGK